MPTCAKTENETKLTVSAKPKPKLLSQTYSAETTQTFKCHSSTDTYLQHFWGM